MTNDDGPTLRVRGLVGRNIAELLAASNTRQEDLAGRIRGAGAADWPQETVSRYVKGSRALTLEDTLVLAAALRVPVVRLLAGSDRVSLNGSEVSAAQVRDVLLHGRVQSDHANGSVLDTLAAGEEAAAGTSVEQQLAGLLQLPVTKVVRASFGLWGLPPDDELDTRMRRSRERFTGGKGGATDVLAQVLGEMPQVTQRQLRAWRGHHVAAMAEDLAEAVAR